MKRFLLVALCGLFLLTACEASTQQIEQGQQKRGIDAIITNQPVPDLGGYSFERQIVIETYLARNRTIATYAYMITMNGQIIEICPSIGYPIPYSTELTNPQIALTQYSGYPVVANPEPNGLYPPGDAAATLVQCVNPDGSVSPVYIEWYVLAFPYQIKADVKLQRLGEPSFSVEVK